MNAKLRILVQLNLITNSISFHLLKSNRLLECLFYFPVMAHRRLPFGTRVRVCHGRCVTVHINDRGPWVRGRDIDLTPAAARAIGLNGTGRVTMSRL